MEYLLPIPEDVNHKLSNQTLIGWVQFLSKHSPAKKG